MFTNVVLKTRFIWGHNTSSNLQHHLLNGGHNFLQKNRAPSLLTLQYPSKRGDIILSVNWNSSPKNHSSLHLPFNVFIKWMKMRITLHFRGLFIFYMLRRVEKGHNMCGRSKFRSSSNLRWINMHSCFIVSNMEMN